MDKYSLFRQIADSWVLLLMFGFFVGAILFAWRPGSRKAHEEAASCVFRNEDAPARARGMTPGPTHGTEEEA
ncbi:MAG: cbb3-type cytochrome c oxidase subunit 3 [Rhodobacteraceae bacterium]|nr:cbb3-type cytochrome c oxidase subunit 3 [Paracoccaceae bacterium]